MSAEKGLLFVSYQTSLELQFEEVHREWLVASPMGSLGGDPLFGGLEHDRPFFFSFPVVLTDGDMKKITLKFRRPFVWMTGGDYFFCPSLEAVGLLGR
jgi:hypothetical protein